ncbi:MAG TPA: hypothetical protein VGA42_10595 [Gemmatimonadales bacterium]
MRKHSLDGEVEAGTNRPLRGATGPRSGLRALSLAVLHLVFTTPPAMAQAPSGTFILECGEENVLMGIHGRVGLWIDQLEGWCIQIDGAGRWLGTPFTTMRAGGSGGIGPYDLRCPSGEALYKLEGTSGRYVNSIKLFCIKLASDGHVTGGAIERGAVRGGMAALDRWTQTCSGDQPAMAVSGFDGDYVDAFFTTVCAYPVILKRLWVSQTQVSGLGRLGRLHQSRRLLEEVLAEGGAIGADDLILRGEIGVVAALQGDLRTVEDMDRRLRELDRPFLNGLNTEYRARMAALLGRKEDAFRLLQQATTEGYGFGLERHQAFEYLSLRGYPPFDEFMRPKG